MVPDIELADLAPLPQTMPYRPSTLVSFLQKHDAGAPAVKEAPASPACEKI